MYIVKKDNTDIPHSFTSSEYLPPINQLIQIVMVNHKAGYACGFCFNSKLTPKAKSQQTHKHVTRHRLLTNQIIQYLLSTHLFPCLVLH